MKDKPLILKVMLAMSVGVFALMMYAQSGLKEVPKVNNPWDIAASYVSDIENRNVILSENEIKERKQLPYLITLERFKNGNDGQVYAQYRLIVDPIKPIPFSHEWLKGGLEWGIVDFSPNEEFGAVRLVAIRNRTIPE
ncbi:MAG: hypothetical protein KDK51_05260 [Deltaproteobacteria bacterium]|nr:hypothetical protein [Deltaproteobacteria bacterium]